MAASMQMPFKPHGPVTPPPDQQMFTKGPLPPYIPMSFTQEGAFTATGASTLPQDASNINKNNTDCSQQLNTSTPSTIPPLSSSVPSPFGVDPSNQLQDLAKDPRYIAMASRIASYYQQRCQAIANFQQQRCQQWANMHRQKCQEMMQAAMLIVAWYIRDRISRRRRRQKRAFKRGLARKNNTRGKITKGESVRRWVMDVPLVNKDNNTAVPPATAYNPVHDKLTDEEEAAFSMDKDEEGHTTAAAAAGPQNLRDKDAHLFTVADNLIKSNLARIDIPLLGALSFEESDTESESSYADDDYEDEELGDYDDDEDEDEDEDEMMTAENQKDDEVDHDEASKGVQFGSKGSRKRTRSSVS
ncbi:hypothetical protein B0H63DRAFT_55069 [Podospora didyma]|uniref:Uncharacterized protein n=1 Tax=Podospora didyma TaxID=330526 RepID=A0AAE0P7B8_9PEZI|nr:hypothetical protein B0H63DRAFT_55069 [Podospora didyma]